jgi:long-chain acyl-CoA synthetase
MSKLTIPSLLNESVRNYPNNESLVFVGEENYTYQQLGNDVDLVSNFTIKLRCCQGR